CESDAPISTGGTLTNSDVDNAETFVAQASTAGTYGTFTVDANGVWTYTASDAYDELNVGTSYSDTFQVAATDGTMTSVTVTINGTNDAAVLSSATVDVDETDAPISTGGTLTNSDVDNAETFVAQASTAGTYGTFTVDANGVWTYTASDAYDELNVGTSYSDTFQVAATDGTMTSVTVTINGTNDAAVLSSATVDVDETDAPISTGGTLTNSDVDNAETFVAQASTAGTYGTFTVDANGVWTYTASDAYDELNVGTSYSDTFQVAATDGTMTSVTVTINGTNDAAVLSSATVDVDETDAPISTGGTLTNSDVDNAETFVAQASTAGTYGTFTVDANGVWTYTASDAYDELNVGTSYSDTFQVAATDGTMTSVTVTINGTNDAAVLSSATVDVDETDAPISTGGTLTNSDVDNAETFVAQASTAGTYGTFTVDANGVWTYTASDAYDELNVGTSYSDTFQVAATDGTMTSVTVTINGTNDAAVLSSATVDVDETDAPISTGGTLTNSDVDNAETFVAQASTAGTYGTFTVDANGVWTYTASDAYDELNVGTSYSDTFQVAATDGTMTSVTVTINGTNDAAVLSSATVDVDETDAPISTGGTLTNSDVDNAETFVAQASTAGTYGTFTVDANGVWTYTASDAYDELNVGTSYSDTFQVAATDGTMTSVTVTINGTNDAAVLSSATVDVDETDAPISTGGTLTNSDVDNAETFVAQASTAGT